MAAILLSSAFLDFNSSQKTDICSQQPGTFSVQPFWIYMSICKLKIMNYFTLLFVCKNTASKARESVGTSSTIDKTKQPDTINWCLAMSMCWTFPSTSQLYPAVLFYQLARRSYFAQCCTDKKEFLEHR